MEHNILKTVSTDHRSRVDGRYVYSLRPKIDLFSNLHKLRLCGINLRDWASIYGLPVEHVSAALTEILPGGVLQPEYIAWVLTQEEDPEEF